MPSITNGQRIKPIGRTHDLLDRDFLTPRKHRKLYRIGNDKDRNNRQADHHGQRHDVEHMLYLDQAGNNRLIRTHTVRPLDSLNLLDRLLCLRRILHGKHKAVAQRVVVRIELIQDIGILASCRR